MGQPDWHMTRTERRLRAFQTEGLTTSSTKKMFRLEKRAGGEIECVVGTFSPCMPALQA